MQVNSGKEEVDSVVKQCQPWSILQRASFSYNDFHSIDYSIVSDILICLYVNTVSSTTSRTNIHNIFDCVIS